MDFSAILNGEGVLPPKVGHPNFLILSGPPGVGKSTLSNGLNQNGYKCLVIDFQSGLGHVGGNVIDLKVFGETYKMGSLAALQAIVKKLQLLKRGVEVVKEGDKQVEKQITPVQWDFVVLDPISYLQPIIVERAAQLYNNSVIGLAKAKQIAEGKFGKGFTEAQLKSCFSTDPSGDPNNNAGDKGWGFIKTAFTEVFYSLKSIPTECFIVVAHLKYKSLTKTDGVTIDISTMDFWPSYTHVMIAEASDSAAVVRKPDGVYLNFTAPKENEIFKSRHFDSQEILISEKVGDEIKYYWEKIFPFLSTPK